jgi:hypothetical protein
VKPRKGTQVIKNILPLTILLLSVTASANETWVGYKPIEKVSAPHKDVAINSVLEMTTVTLLSSKPNEYELVETATTKKTTNQKKLNSDFRTLQIETCRNQGLQLCPVFKYSFSGTAFVNNGSEIYTCRHMVHNWMMIAAKENNVAIEKLNPPMWLKDNKKNIVYNSATAKDLLNVTLNSDPRLNFVLREFTTPRENKEDLLYYQSEFVMMKSGIDLVPALSISIGNVANQTPGQQVYFTGFPAKTTYFGSNSRGDTPGKIMVSSTGKLVAVSTSLQLFLSDNLGSGGMSGGMVTDDAGQLIGIFCKSEDITDPKVLLSTSVILDPLAQLKLWEHLKSLPLAQLSL